MNWASYVSLRNFIKYIEYTGFYIHTVWSWSCPFWTECCLVICVNPGR